MIIAYIKSSTGNQPVCNMQKQIIERYVGRHRLECQHYFEDCGKVKRGASLTRQMQAKGFSELRDYDKIYPAWEQMLCFVMENPVTAIIVDLKSRLHMMEKQNRIFQQICNEKGICIIEAIDDEPVESVSSRKAVAIYHFTNHSEIRPIVFEKEIDKMYTYVSRQKCWDTPYVYIDYEIKKSMHEKYNCFRRNVREYDVLLVTDYFHIEDKLGTFMKEMIDLHRNGVDVISLKEGKIRFINRELLKRPLSITSYIRTVDSEDVNLERDRITMFVEYKTQWTVEDIYIEETKAERDSEQQLLPRLLANSDKYDAVLLKQFNHLHWRTSMFFKIVRQLKLPIYSMKEGGIYLEEERNT